jgi:hypothetical protein
MDAAFSGVRCVAAILGNDGPSGSLNIGFGEHFGLTLCPGALTFVNSAA